MTLVVFGDSITQAVEQKPDDRWPEILGRALAERFTTADIRVVNAGVGGNTSREGLARIERDVLRHRPRWVTFEFGNDATHEPDRHVSPEEFEENLDRIIQRVSDEAGGLAIPMTFPPIVDAWHASRHQPFYNAHGGMDRYQDLYREATRRVAHAHGLPLVDLDRMLRKEMGERGPASCILPDGVHLTVHGNACVARAVRDVLSPEIEKVLNAQPR